MSKSTDDTNLIALNVRRKPVHYTVRMTQHWDDSLEVFVEDVADDDRSRASVADALRRAAEMIAEGGGDSPEPKGRFAPNGDRLVTYVPLKPCPGPARPTNMIDPETGDLYHYNPIRFRVERFATLSADDFAAWKASPQSGEGG